MSEEIEIKTEIEKNSVKEHNDVDVQARDIKWRAKHTALAQEHENFKVQSDNEKKQLSEKTIALEQKAQSLSQKMIEAELKAHAVVAGIKDVDFIKLIDISGLKIGENGSIDGLEKTVNDFKSMKPNLFGNEKLISSSSNVKLPENVKTQLTALDLDDKQWQAEKNRFMSGNFNI